MLHVVFLFFKDLIEDKNLKLYLSIEEVLYLLLDISGIPSSKNESKYIILNYLCISHAMSCRKKINKNAMICSQF